MVDRYITELVEMFISEYTPAQICAELGLCNKGINALVGDENDILSNDIPNLVEDEENSLESLEESSEEFDDNSIEPVQNQVWVFYKFHVIYFKYRV